MLRNRLDTGLLRAARSLLTAAALARGSFPILVLGLTAGCADKPTESSVGPNRPKPELSLGSGSHQIHIDATALTAAYLDLSLVGQVATGAPVTVNVDPGNYTLSYSAGVGTRTRGVMGENGAVTASGNART